MSISSELCEIHVQATRGMVVSSLMELRYEVCQLHCRLWWGEEVGFIEGLYMGQLRQIHLV